jgi:type II secretory pathway pseudopilin PulG
MHPSPRRRRAGFTLIEMMMAILLTMLVFGITVPFFRVQTQAVDTGAGRLDALQNARYAQNAIDRELRLAGGVTGQPVIVQADKFAVTFNVDLVTRSSLDPNATYYTPTADTLAVEAWEPSRKKALPNDTKQYPLTLYTDESGIQSPAETISYFLKADASTGRNDLYTLFRRVNDRDSTVVTRNIWIPVDTNYFFRYYKTDATGAISAIAMGSLPIYWDAASRLADSIRVVEMRVAGLYRDVRKARDVTRTIYHKTRLLNAGLLRQRTCGTAPLGPQAVTAVRDTSATGTTVSVTTTWTNSLEESSGEADVATYLVMRRPSAGTDWEVLGNVVARGYSSYTWVDFNYRSGSWVYGVVAQDCSPANSSATAAASLVIP